MAVRVLHLQREQNLYMWFYIAMDCCSSHVCAGCQRAKGTTAAASQAPVQGCPLWSRHPWPAPPHSPPSTDSSTLHTISVLPLSLISRSAPNRLHHLPLDRAAALPTMPCPYIQAGKQSFLSKKGCEQSYFLLSDTMEIMPLCGILPRFKISLWSSYLCV